MRCQRTLIEGCLSYLTSSDLNPKDHLQWFAKISQLGGEGTRCEELLATQLDKWILWSREVAEVVKLDAIQQKLGYTCERSCPNHSPSPARLRYFLLDRKDHIPWATISSGVTGHLGTTQVQITEEGGQTFHMWMFPHLQESQAAPLLRGTPQRDGNFQSKEKMPGS